MARALKETLTLCLALGLTSIALGQDRQQPPPQAPSVLGPLLSNSDVQKELKLSDEQLTKLKDALNKVMDKYKDDFTKFDRMAPDERQKKIMAINEDSNKAISGVMNGQQWKRFKQIQWQLNGLVALQDPDLQNELKLSDVQKKKMEGVFSDAEKKMQEMMKSGERSPEKYQAMIKDIEKKANDVLTEEQQKNLKEVKGPSFQLSRPGAQAPRPPSAK